MHGKRAIVEPARLLTACELRKRVWDDYDRLRKVPAAVSPEFAQYLGHPLCDVPDPSGQHESYAARYISEFTTGLEHLGIFPQYVRQSEAYRSGMYTRFIKEALAEREAIF